MEITVEQLIEIEKQLSCPEGEKGIEIAENMNESNISMTIDTIKSLQITDSDIVLEIGHGNCAHLLYILKEAQKISYFGLEISETMQKEAQRLNEKNSINHAIGFHLYDGENIPFPMGMFNKIMTVNTIYFWKDPISFMKEMYRVLNPGGIAVLAFAKKQFMETLPFVNDEFTLYDNESVKVLIEKTSFTLCEVIEKKEKVKSKTGELVEREFSIVVLTKTF